MASALDELIDKKLKEAEEKLFEYKQAIMELRSIIDIRNLIKENKE